MVGFIPAVFAHWLQLCCCSLVLFSSSALAGVFDLRDPWRRGAGTVEHHRECVGLFQHHLARHWTGQQCHACLQYGHSNYKTSTL